MLFTAAEGGQGDSPAEKKGICYNNKIQLLYKLIIPVI